jgi:hypothetical protein
MQSRTRWPVKRTFSATEKYIEVFFLWETVGYIPGIDAGATGLYYDIAELFNLLCDGNLNGYL